jgi:hypothetical protein
VRGEEEKKHVPGQQHVGSKEERTEKTAFDTKQISQIQKHMDANKTGGFTKYNVTGRQTAEMFKKEPTAAAVAGAGIITGGRPYKRYNDDGNEVPT